jgi:hypothetical protein
MFVFTNIVGNCVATLVVAKWEKAIDTTVLDAELNAGAHSRSSGLVKTGWRGRRSGSETDPSPDDHFAALAEQSSGSGRPAPDVVDESARGPR